MDLVNEVRRESQDIDFASPIGWIDGLHQVLRNTKCKLRGEKASIDQAVSEIQALFKKTRESESNLWWVGNGGSAGICAHLSQDALNKLKVRSQVLADAPLLTCIANDFGYENIYSRPLETLTKPGDMLIAISSSGKSKNILNCVELARRREMSIVTLSAFDEKNPLWNEKADVSLYLKSELYGIVEVGHEALLHAAIETMWLEEKNH